MVKILVAEDEKDIRELITFTLRFAGFEVTAVPNGLEAVNSVESEKPDLILMDVRMPKMTGYEACQILKDNPETTKIPVVFLSAKGQEKEISQGIESGAEQYILKPFAPDELTNQVKTILRRFGHEV